MRSCGICANGYKTYIVTGGTQLFVRAFAANTYGIPPEQIIGTTVTTSFNPQKRNNDLMLDAKMLLNNNYAGKAEDIYLFTGRRPQIAFGNTAGDQQMLEYTTAGDGARLGLLVLHDEKEANTLTVPQRACLIQKLAPSLRHSTTKRKQKVGPLSV